MSYTCYIRYDSLYTAESRRIGGAWKLFCFINTIKRRWLYKVDVLKHLKDSCPKIDFESVILYKANILKYRKDTCQKIDFESKKSRPSYIIQL